MAAFQTALPKLEAEGIGVFSASSDRREDAEAEAKELKLTFPFGYGLPVDETAAKLGAFHGEYPAPRGRFLQSTGFVLSPDRKIAVAVYSTGPIGRLVWQDVLGIVQFIKQKK